MLEKIVKRQTYHIANAVFVIFWLVYFCALFSHPFLGLALEQQGRYWIVTDADLYGNGYHSGIRAGDIIVNIDDKNPGLYPSVQQWREIDEASFIEVKSHGQSSRIIRITENPLFLILLKEIPMALLSLAFWITGLITWIKRPFLVQARVLYWLNWFIGLAIILAPASSRQLLWGRELELLCFSFIPPILVNFVSVFPVERKNRAVTLTTWILTALSLVTVVLLGLKTLGYIFIISELKKILLAETLLASVISLWHLVLLAKLSADKPEKNQIIIVLTGVAVGLLPFALLTALPIVLYGNPLLDPNISAVFVLAIPVSFSYVIVNKYLPDGRGILEPVIINLVSGILASIAFSYLAIKTGLIKTVNYQTYFIVFSLMLIFLLLIGIIKTVIKAVLNKTMIVNQRELTSKIKQLNESLASVGEELLIEEIILKLQLEAAFVVAEDGRGWYIKKAAGRFLENQNEQEVLEKYYYLHEKKENSATLLPEDFPAEVFLPFSLGDITGGIFLGHRCSHVKFQAKELFDLSFLSYEIAQRLAGAHKISRLSREIETMAKEMQESQRRTQGLRVLTKSLFMNLEEEKKVIAREIHDGPLQLGLEANRRLKHILREVACDEITSTYISATQEIVEELNYELRSICTDLRPSSLTDLGLLPAVESMCRQIMEKELLIISLRVKNLDREQRFKENIEICAFRLLQEGLTNVVKHSGASQAEVSISLHGGKLELIVSDTGKGFNIEKINDWALTGTRFGIAGMRERIRGLNGEFEIQAIAGHGVKLKASIPIS